MTPAPADADRLAARRELETKLLRRRRPPDPIDVLPRLGDDPQAFRASLFQEGAWELLHRKNEPVPLILGGLRLSGDLRVDVLERALNAAVARHESLRSTLRVEDGRLMQVIAPHAPIVLPVTEISAADLPALVHAEVDAPIDPALGPLYRVRLLRLGAGDHLLLLMLLHIIGDGHSLEVLAAEVATRYRAALDGADVPVPPLTVQYPDFAAWHRRRMAGARGTELTDYWTRRLAGATPAVLPTDLDPSEPVPVSGDSRIVPMPAAVFGELAAFCRATRTTAYTVGLAAFAVLLARYSGQRDLCVRSPVTFRDRSEMAGVVADFANDVVVRVDLTGDPSFATVLARVGADTARDFAQHELPPHMLRPLLTEPGTADGFARVQFTAERPIEVPPPMGDRLTAEPMAMPDPYARHVLNLRLRLGADSAYTVWLYRSALISPGRVQQLARDYHDLLARMVREPASRVFDTAG